MIWLALWFAMIAVSSTVPVTPERLPAFMLGFWFGGSLVGQLFALPFALICAVLAITGGEVGTVLLLAISGGLFGFVHLRNRRAGRLLLDQAGMKDTAIPLLAGLAPLLTGRGAVRRIAGLPYGDKGTRQKLDLIVPREPRSDAMPILIHVPGGAWVTGRKNQQAKPLLNHLAARGWLCVDINYRLGPRHKVPDMIEDVLRAVAWVRAHAAEHGGDPARIAITGGSAGGHLSSLAALAHDDPAFKPGFENADCSVAAAVPLYGRFDFLDRSRRLGSNHKAVIENFMGKRLMPGMPTACPQVWHAVSPLDRVRADAPPMLVMHGTGDSLLPHGEGEEFAESLRAVSFASVVYHELPGIQHAWDVAASALTWAHVRVVEAFLNESLKREPLPQARPGAKEAA